MKTKTATAEKSAILLALDAAAKAYADARAELRDRAVALDDITRRLQKRRLPGIRSALAKAQDAKAALETAIETHRSHFAHPKTTTLHGIRMGYAKGKGKIEWEIEDAVLAARIQKLLPDQYDILVKVTCKPLKTALQQLPAADLRKLGVTVEESGEAVYIAATDSQLDKLLKKLLKEGAQDTDATEEADADA